MVIVLYCVGFLAHLTLLTNHHQLCYFQKQAIQTNSKTMIPAKFQTLVSTLHSSAQKVFAQTLVDLVQELQFLRNLVVQNFLKVILLQSEH